MVGQFSYLTSTSQEVRCKAYVTGQGVQLRARYEWPARAGGSPDKRTRALSFNSVMEMVVGLGWPSAKRTPWVLKQPDWGVIAVEQHKPAWTSARISKRRTTFSALQGTSEESEGSSLIPQAKNAVLKCTEKCPTNTSGIIGYFWK